MVERVSFPSSHFLPILHACFGSCRRIKIWCLLSLWILVRISCFRCIKSGDKILLINLDYWNIPFMWPKIWGKFKINFLINHELLRRKYYIQGGPSMTLSRKPPRKPPHFGFWKSRPKVVKFWFGHLQENGGVSWGFPTKSRKPPHFLQSCNWLCFLLCLAVNSTFYYIWLLIHSNSNPKGSLESFSAEGEQKILQKLVTFQAT